MNVTQLVKNGHNLDKQMLDEKRNKTEADTYDAAKADKF